MKYFLLEYTLISTVLLGRCHKCGKLGHYRYECTYAIKVAIQESLDEEYTVCCATPTGILTSTYRAHFVEETFYCDTIHSMFKYPVESSKRPAVNWELGRFDLLMVDELSMVPVKIFDHIASTLRQLHVRPVVLLCGDQQQQQPIELVSICLHYNILFKAKHIPGVHNKMADALSRLQVQTFRHLAPPQMDSLPTEIPQYLQPQNWVLS